MNTTTACCSALQQYVDMYDANDLELELRLGRLIQFRNVNRFDANITKSAWQSIWQALSGYRGWEVIVCEICTDYSMPGGDRLTHSDDGSWKTITKKRCQDFDFQTQEAFDIRVSLSSEVAALPQKVPRPQDATYVRHKDRISFRRRGWSIDLTKVRAQSSSNDDDDSETFEVEVELIDKSVLACHPLEAVVSVGLQLCKDVFKVANHE